MDLKTISEIILTQNKIRNELKNIRTYQKALVNDQKKKIEYLIKKIQNVNNLKTTCVQGSSNSTSLTPEFHPIGFIESMHIEKNGTPRQAGICTTSRSKLTISQKSIGFTNPHHSLEGLEEFSHVWLIFVFHENGSKGKFTGAKIKPPRLDGKKLGVFATRTPHRPNPIGLSLARIDKIEGNILYLEGTDLINGTPILDLKPFVPFYDSPFKHSISQADDSILLDVEHNFINKSTSKVSNNIDNDKYDKNLIHQKHNDFIDKDTNKNIQFLNNKEVNVNSKYSFNNDFNNHVNKYPDRFKLKDFSTENVNQYIITNQYSNGENTYIPKLENKDLKNVESVKIADWLKKKIHEDNSKQITVKKVRFTSSAIDQILKYHNNLERSFNNLEFNSDINICLINEKANLHNNIHQDINILNKLPFTDLSFQDELLKNELNNYNTIDHVLISKNDKNLELENIKINVPDLTRNSDLFSLLEKQKTSYDKLNTGLNTPKIEQLIENQISILSHDVVNYEKHNQQVDCKTDQFNFFNFLQGPKALTKAIEEILYADPRSSYRRKKCSDKLYYFCLDSVHITCWFDEDCDTFEVVRVRPKYSIS